MLKPETVVAIGTFARPVTGQLAIELALEIPSGLRYCPVHYTYYLSIASCQSCSVSLHRCIVSSQRGILAFQRGSVS